MNTSLRKILILMFMLLIAGSQKALAHPLGITVTNMKYNKGTLTLSTRIFYMDFWSEFQSYTKVKNKDYVKQGIDASDKKDFSNYFRKNYRVWINNKELLASDININFERHEEDAYILIVNLNYNVKNMEKAKIKLRNTILLNTISGQKHMYNFYLKDPNVVSHGIVTLDKENPVCDFVNE